MTVQFFFQIGVKKATYFGEIKLDAEMYGQFEGFPFNGALFGLVIWPLLSTKILPGSALSSLSTLL